MKKKMNSDPVAGFTVTALLCPLVTMCQLQQILPAAAIGTLTCGGKGRVNLERCPCPNNLCSIGTNLRE